MTVIIGVLAIIVVGVLIISGKARILLKGFINMFVTDIAKTPEGAKAVYSEAIDKAMDRYRQASDTLQNLAGKQNELQNKISGLRQSLNVTEGNAERLAKAGKFDQVSLYAQEREDLLLEISSTEKMLADLGPMVEDAKTIAVAMETQVRNLKKERDRVVNELTMGKQMKEMYDQLDALKANSNLDKLVIAAQEGAKEAKSTAAGAKIVHENKLSTKLERAGAEATKLQTNTYVDELRKKYQAKA